MSGITIGDFVTVSWGSDSATGLVVAKVANAVYIELTARPEEEIDLEQDLVLTWSWQNTLWEQAGTVASTEGDKLQIDLMGTPQGIENRQARRVPTSLPISVKLGLFKTITGTIQDLSITGLGASMPVPFEERAKIQFTLLNPVTLKLSGTVIRCQQQDNSHWDCGIAFQSLTPMEHEILQSLIRQFAPF